MAKELKLSEEFELKGYWWLPYNPDYKVAGILKYTPGKILLELIGSLKGDTDTLDFLINTEKTDLIYGIDSEAQEVTLLTCFLSSSINLSSPFALSNYSCSFAVIGKYVQSLDEVCHYNAFVRIPELSYWCFPSLLKSSFEFDDTRNNIQKTKWEIDCKDYKQPISQVVIDDNSEFRLMGTTEYGVGRMDFRPNVEQYTYIELSNPNGMSINKILSYIFFIAVR